MSLDINLINIQSIPIVVNANITAENNKVYHVIANATFTDPTGVNGTGYTVLLVNGTFSFLSGGGTFSQRGTLVFRQFLSGSWYTLTHDERSYNANTFVPQTRTINGLDLTTNRTLTTANINDSTNRRYVTDAQSTVIGNTSGTNTGDETQASILSKLNLFHLDVAPSSVLTGTTSPTQLGVVVIPANSINANDSLKIYTPCIKTGGAAACTIVYKLSTSSTMPSGTTGRIATFSAVSNNTLIPMQRNPVYNGGNLTIFIRSVNSLTDLAIASVNAPTVVELDRTVTQYLYIEATLANSADSIYLAGGRVTNM